MRDTVEIILGALAVALGGAAFTVGGEVIREAWRDPWQTSSGARASPRPRGPEAPASRAETANGTRLLRAIAGFQALKGLLALAAAAGLLGMLHHDLRGLAGHLIGHIGPLGRLDHVLGWHPHGADPSAALTDFLHWLGSHQPWLLLAACSYAVLRFSEAYGLWQARPWGEWLGCLSGAVYVPFELRHLVLAPSLVGAVVLAANLAVVGFLSCRLRGRQLRRLQNSVSTSLASR